MQKVLGSARCGLLVLCGTCLAVGCKGEPKLPPLVPVAGTVTVGGQLAKGGSVSLIPLEKGTVPEGMMPVGTIDSAGKYTIMTAGQNGAPVGRYKVAVSPSTMPSADGKPAEQQKIYEQYTASKTDLQISVEANHGAYDLTLKEKEKEKE